MTSIRPSAVNHVNFVPDDYDAAVRQLTEFYGARFLLDVPIGEPDRACLIDLGRVVIELFTPGFASRLKSFRGACSLGVEYVADVAQARQAMAERGFDMSLDYGSVIHAHADDCFGLAIEFFAHAFLGEDRPAAIAPPASAAYWRDEHPLGLLGLKAYCLAVNDAEAAAAFFADFLSGERRYDEERPAIGARAVGLHVGDGIVELLAPTGPGPLAARLARDGEGMISTVFRVASLDRARAFHAARGVELAAGTDLGRLAAPLTLNRGMAFEFSE